MSRIEFVLLENVLRRGRPVRDSIQSVADWALSNVRDHPSPLRLAEVHEALILDDSRNPGVELGIPSKSVQVLEGG